MTLYAPLTSTTVADLRGKYLRTARDDMFRAQLDRLLVSGPDGAPTATPKRYTATGETRGVTLVDGAGGGKTSLVHNALSKHPALQRNDAGQLPWVSVRVPSPATLKALGLEILRRTGYSDVSERRERWAIWNLVRHRLAMLGTVVLWIDEAHDVFLSGNAREANDVLKTLKSLMQGEGAVIVVLTGVEELWRITACDEQVQRRYAKLVLPPVSAAADGAMLANALRGYCAMARVEAPTDADLIERLIHASRGRFGRCLEAMINAIELAVEGRQNRLDMGHFVENFAMQEGCEPARNPFLSPRWSLIDLDAAARR